MKKAVIQFAVVLFLMSAATASAQNVSAGVSINSGHNNFYLAIGDYYRVPEPRVVYVRDTLALEHVLVSEACLPLLAERAGLELASRPESLTFDERGRLRSAFA